ncbi:MAG: hypothetical protein IJU75_02590 [Clostridia bacterium]|nr:hypothetical protein [Clostridia bacterium]
MRKFLYLFIVAALLLSFASCAPAAVPGDAGTGTKPAPDDPPVSDTSSPTSTDPVTEKEPQAVATETVTEHVHSYGSDLYFDEEGHYSVCSDCGEATEKTPHEFGEWITISEPTEESEGLSERVCTICHYRETSTIEKLEHVHVWSETLTADKTDHWHVCTGCGEADAKQKHTFGEWTVTKAATTESKGTKERSCAVCGFTVTEDIPMLEKLEIPENVAKVIVISGQSNAVGYSYSGFLDKDYFDVFSAERRERAYAGYPNVLIRYSNNPLDANQGTCGNSGFEPVKIGMGAKIPDPFYYNDSWGEPFGAEVGIAEYLTEKYPDETFYIIKCATSGTSLSWRWNPNRSGDLFDNMIGFVGGVLGDMKSGGLKPEIISFCWMQGESDAQEKNASYIYLFDTLLNKFRTAFAEYMPKNGMSVADGGIMTFWQNMGLPQIDMNAAKKNYAEKSSKNFFIETASWSRDVERTASGRGHFDSYSMIVLGRKFGECIEKALLDYGNPAVLK